MTDIHEQYRRIPKLPGVYRFLDARKRVLYVGKAKNLHRRVSSYFQRTNSLEPSKQLMVRKIEEIDYTVTGSELEALLHEATQIKQYHPPYNIVLRDDSNFLYIKVTLKEEFPTLIAVRHVKTDGSRYFGPFPSAAAARSTIALLKRLFGFRTCTPHQGKPCFDVHLHRCTGPCADMISQNEYLQTVVKPILDFLTGNNTSVIKTLTAQMERAAANEEFERAAAMRDRLKAVKQVTERQVMISSRREVFDAVGLARDRDWAAVNVFGVRGGRLLQKKNFLLEHPSSTSDEEILAAFMEQYYPSSPDRPAAVFVAMHLPAAEKLGKVLGIRIHQSQRGAKKTLLSLATTNAREYLERRKLQWLAEHDRARQAEEQLLHALRLKRLPHRIEAYDISNIQGTNAVGSMVVFEGGKPVPASYRKFTIRTKHQPDDFAMMAEMLERRLREHDWPLPDLLLVDGGKGQLSYAAEVLQRLGCKTPVVALAKREEELFVPGNSQPILLAARSPALFLVQRLRDEAHRFAITFYRSKHRKSLRTSALDAIPGIGPASRRALLRAFGSLERIRAQNKRSIASVIGASKADSVLKALRKPPSGR